MKIFFHMISVVSISCLLSSCFAAALFGAGAGAGYIYARERDRGGKTSTNSANSTSEAKN